jgi:hypothetical protein
MFEIIDFVKKDIYVEAFCGMAKWGFSRGILDCFCWIVKMVAFQGLGGVSQVMWLCCMCAH